MLEFFLLVCGMAGLWVGSEVLIRGAISLADRYNVSDAMIGMFILAIGTDLPELFVTVDASFRSLAGEDLSGIVIGTALGSSIGQFGLVVGVTGFIGFSPRPLRLATRNSLFLIGGLIVLALFTVDGLMSRIEGWVLVVIYFAYLLSLFYWKTENTELNGDADKAPLTKAVVYLVAGLGLLFLAAELTVVSAINFATVVGLSNLSVSAIIIGMGSSLPELAIAIVALLKNRSGLSVGNLMGSNVLDTLLVPGLGAAISPLVIPATALWLDLPVLALLTVLVLGFLYVSPRGVKKIEASIILAIYLGYAYMRLITN
jgi:cation:H+ antiporter